MPTVSVVIPVRNGAQYIAEALRSILVQDLEDIEVVIVDDGSSDDGMAVARSMGDARVRIVPNAGSGIVDALNMGLSLAQAPLLARMDCDDIALPGRLRLQASRFDADADLQLLGSAGLAIDSTGRVLGAMEVPLDDHELREAFSTRNPVLHPTAMFRTQAARRLGGYRRAFTFAEDYDLWLRLSEAGRLANLDAPLVKLRTHSGQTSKTRRDQQKAAAALTRRTAALRRLGEEPFDAASRPEEAIGAFLAWRAADGRAVSPAECRDIELMLRTPGLPGGLARRMLLLAAVGSPSFRTLALGPRLAWHRVATRLAIR